MSVINQKEYLKKYLSSGKNRMEKKKKKKKTKVALTGFKIIDDDADTFDNSVQEDLLGESEDAPQIVAVIDDRPPSLRIDETNHTPLWIPIGEREIKNEDTSCANSILSSNSKFKIVAENYDKNKKDSLDRKGYRDRRSKQLCMTQDDGSCLTKDILPLQDITVKQEAMSPIRDSEISIPISSHRTCLSGSEDSSQVLQMVKSEVDNCLPRKNSDSDMSPPRKDVRGRDISPPRKNNYSDMSPPRKKVRGRDMSPPRKNSDSDMSPPRKDVRSKDMSPPRKNRDSDMSPSRKDIQGSDMSPPRRSSKKHNFSPSRYDHTMPPAKKTQSRKREMSPKILHRSPPRKNPQELPIRKHNELLKNTKGSEVSLHKTKMLKTLDGKTAGLQNAIQLMQETIEIKRKEEELFKNMSSEMSGINASTIVRDKNTGRVKNLLEEAARDQEKRRKENVSKEKYSRWGKGLKQVEDATAQQAEILHEMNKPLARYADDEDLEKYLKEQEWEGDPMLAYIRKKKKKQDVDEGKPIKPTYMGEFMPNRFGIRPGHRWDGVDRSNGYEKRWFDVQNSKLAQQEESYKWSTEDM